RVGGRVRVVMRDPDGEPVAAGGEYTLIERPHRLAFTWTFDDAPSNQQMIELEFTERDGVTTVLFVNSDISEARREAQDEGWRTCFDEIGRLLASK
ncbi:MAG: SRPBCC domain-containing protein, partial [Solirubrobacterales bacterium]